MKEGVRFSFAILLTMVFAGVLAGCNPVKEESAATTVAAAPTTSVNVEKIPTTQQGAKAITLVDRVVWKAQKQQGKMYRWGGTSPTTGFDCSGLTQYAFKNGAQIALPRTAAEQYQIATKISAAQATKGDLVFFRTSGKRISHVGIYLGNNRFVHAPRTGRAITTENLTGYWARTLVGFGRIPGTCKPSYS